MSRSPSAAKPQIHAARIIRKGHFEQRRDQAAGRYVVSGQHLAFGDQVLHRRERFREIIGGLYGRHFHADAAERLRQAAAAQTESRAAHVDVYQLVRRCFSAGDTAFLTSDTPAADVMITVRARIPVRRRGISASSTASPCRSEC